MNTPTTIHSYGTSTLMMFFTSDMFAPVTIPLSMNGSAIQIPNQPPMYSTNFTSPGMNFHMAIPNMVTIQPPHMCYPSHANHFGGGAIS